MKTHNIGRKLEKWCKKQAKKLQKQQATLSNAASVNYAAKSSFSAEPIKQTTAAKSKKAQRKHLNQLLAEYIAKQHIQDLDKAARKQQLKLAKAHFNAANDAQFLSIAAIKRISPLPTERSFALRPYKKSPCGGCPALKGRLCKCALKAMQKRQAS
ncbi:hypothetical protein [Shewanella xiamenensis]|uniref:hypothetical protein n=1 Tax=Shewanella xiamenensis TaxID=332186 RepID=UPI0024A73AD9|nr:hypothetical protein [Shewanella xiamenensis]MDI5837899.1 hypothetical protein [Shewanella xiamenensis]MDI5869521.1 hypothetical protein [Shewanella xiamenensis]